MAQARKRSQSELTANLFHIIKSTFYYAAFILLMLPSIAMLLALITHNNLDPSWVYSKTLASNATIHNWMGIYGAYFADISIYFLGSVVWMLPIGLMGYVLVLFLGELWSEIDVEIIMYRAMGALFSLLLMAAFADLNSQSGGIVGYYLGSKSIYQIFFWAKNLGNGNLQSLFSQALVTVALLITLILATGLMPLQWIDYIGAGIFKIIELALPKPKELNTQQTNSERLVEIEHLMQKDPKISTSTVTTQEPSLNVQNLKQLDQNSTAIISNQTPSLLEKIQGLFRPSASQNSIQNEPPHHSQTFEHDAVNPHKDSSFEFHGEIQKPSFNALTQDEQCLVDTQVSQHIINNISATNHEHDDIKPIIINGHFDTDTPSNHHAQEVAQTATQTDYDDISNAIAELLNFDIKEETTTPSVSFTAHSDFSDITHQPIQMAVNNIDENSPNSITSFDLNEFSSIEFSQETNTKTAENTPFKQDIYHDQTSLQNIEPNIHKDYILPMTEHFQPFNMPDSNIEINKSHTDIEEITNKVLDETLLTFGRASIPMPKQEIVLGFGSAKENIYQFEQQAVDLPIAFGSLKNKIMAENPVNVPLQIPQENTLTTRVEIPHATNIPDNTQALENQALEHIALMSSLIKNEPPTPSHLSNIHVELAARPDVKENTPVKDELNIPHANISSMVLPDAPERKIMGFEIDPRSGAPKPMMAAKVFPFKDQLPDIKLLADPPPYTPAYHRDELEQMARLVEIQLKHFGIDVRVAEIDPGPVITRFELELAPGVKVAQINNLSKDIARGLSVVSVRVVEVIPGKPYVGLELPNRKREIVYFKTGLQSEEYRNATHPMTLILGKDTSGRSIVANLSKMPHLLVAGTTGSGKSVGVNTMLLSLLFKSRPEQVRMILIDPKMLELSVYDGIPHLLTPVVTDMKEAANALRWCVAEMERRYLLMSQLKVRNIEGFNKVVREAIANGTPIPDPLWKRDEQVSETIMHPTLKPLPFIVIVVDEFADMMMLVGKKVEELIARLAQKARASGIHLILATQRPSVDVITGLIKANIPTRIAFQVSSKIDSRTIIDQQGAETLLGHGDMLYLPPGTGIPIRVHGAFVDDHEVNKVVEFLKLTGEADFIDDILQEPSEPIPGLSPEAAGGNPNSTDALYDEAVNIVLESKRASTSFVQRKLRIGYQRAARLIEEMEAAGIVSAPQHNGNREILVPTKASSDYDD